MSSLVIPIYDLGDARLAPYLNLRNRNPIFTSQRFIVESRLLVQRLVDSDYEIESILVDGKEPILDAWLERSAPIYQVNDISSLIGFNFHRGALACGLRKTLRPASDDFQQLDSEARSHFRAVYLHQVQDPENMGSIFRTCAALGINRVIVGPSCVDPYARRVVRVAMGTSLKLTILQDRDPERFLQSLNDSGISTASATLSEQAICLQSWPGYKSWVLFLGNEAHGLPRQLSSRCSHQLTIPMHNHVDSLNVSNAAAIFLYVLSSK